MVREIAMKSGSSADDSTDSLCPPSPPPSPPQAPGDGLTRSQSEWAFQMLLEEISGSSISSSDNATGRSSPHVQSESSVSKPEEPSSDDVVVEIQKPPHNGSRNHTPSSSSVDEMDPKFLESKLELACAAAVALRVRL